MSKGPIDIIAAVEDWSDYPPHRAGMHMAFEIMEALEKNGFKIVKSADDDLQDTRTPA